MLNYYKAILTLLFNFSKFFKDSQQLFLGQVKINLYFEHSGVLNDLEIRQGTQLTHVFMFLLAASVYMCTENRL